MKKLIIKIDNKTISFSEYKRSINDENLNNTNVIDVKNLIFTEEYILENIEMVSTFLNLIVLKVKINKAVIKSLTIAEVSLKLLNNIESIKSIIFKEDEVLSYTVCSLLLENNNLDIIECYNLPEIMFYRFDKNIIKTRAEFISLSNFFNNNNIKTYSELYNKDKIIIDQYLTEQDVNDIIYFFSSNINLKKVEFKRYSRQNLLTILKMIKQNGVKKVNIILWENEFTTNDILNDIKLFDKINKEYNVNIKIRYSKKYKEKNKIKEFNIVLFKYIIIICMVISVLLFLGYKLLDKKNNNVIKNNLEEINKIVHEVEQERLKSSSEEIETSNEQNNLEETIKNPTYVSSYYKNYSKVYNELLSLNSDTVGWLKVNGTKINYPVVQSNDNDYYLNRAYDKSINSAGWIFVDYRNNMDVLNKNTIIYGHSMVKSGLMFSTLKNILNSNWYNNSNNLIIDFSVKGVEYKWQVFSIYTIEETTDYLYSNFKDETSFMEFINKIKNRSINNFNIEVNPNDKILTLSSCYKNNKYRVVLHAKMI